MICSQQILNRPFVILIFKWVTLIAITHYNYNFARKKFKSL